VLYLKGADAVMKNFVNNRQKKGFIDEECKDLSMTGLRTLVISKKDLKEDQYNSWSQKYQEANNKLEVDKK
jgi:magnesium-transporting ATPase (P-type)